MATLLYRIGHLAVRHHRAVIAGWLALLVGLGVAAALLMGGFTAQFSIPGLKSQAALERLSQELPEAGGTTGRVVFQAPPGSTLTDPVIQQSVQAIVERTKTLPAVDSVLPPLPGATISPDGRTGYLQIRFGGESTAIPTETTDAIAALAREHAKDGLRVEVGGAAVAQMPAIGSTEGIGVVVAVVVLLVTFGSVVAAGLPLLSALVGLGVGMSGILLVSGWVRMSETAPILALMLGLAVGIDYALFIVSKHTDQLRRGLDLKESIARANGTAGTAVVFAGLTVVIALVGLTVVGIPFLGVMGLGSAFTVAVAVLIAVTLVPALLAAVGLRVLPRRLRDDVAAHQGEPVAPEQHHTPNRWITWVTGHPVVAVLLGVALLGVVAIPAQHLRLGLPTDAVAPLDTSKRAAYDLVVEGFGAGANNPLVVAVEPAAPLRLDPQVAAALQAQVQQQLMARAQADPDSVAAAGSSGEQLFAMAVRQATAQQLVGEYAARVAQVPNVARATAVAGNAAGTFFVIEVVPGTGAADAATTRLVDDLRALGADLARERGGKVEVTGLNVVEMDISAKLADALPVYLAIVVGLALLLLFLVFRSLVVPIKAVLGFLLSIGASFGAVVAVYQLGWLKDLFGIDTPGPIVSFLPVLLIGILFGLSMDYEMFIVSGMREAHAHDVPARRAVVTGYLAGSRVVTAAAIIMASVFAGFILAPDPIIASMGFALAIGVLFDAFVVRMMIVPAVMWLLGRRAWYLPRWMDRAIPHADVEGAQLLARLRAAEPAAETAHR